MKSKSTRPLPRVVLTLSKASLSGSAVGRTFELVVFGYLTATGRGLLLLAVLGTGLMASRPVSDGPVPVMYVAGAFGVALASVACASAYFLKPRLKLFRRPIPPTGAGGQTRVEIEVGNLSRNTVHDLEVLELHLPDSIAVPDDSKWPVIARLDGGEFRTVAIPVTCAKRGRYVLSRVCAGTAFPLRMCRGLRRSRQETSFLVYPAFVAPETFTVPEGRRHQPGGYLISSNVGESPEFMGTREYRTGDNLRHIHWSSWARLGKPVVKQFHEEYFVRLAVVVDTWSEGPKGEPAFESVLSVTAGIADYLSRRDYLIDVFAVGATVHRFQAGRAIAHLDNILEILACLESSKTVDWRALEDQLTVEAERLTAVVAVFSDWNAEREAMIDRLKTVGVGVKVVVVSDSEAPKPDGFDDDDFICLRPGQRL